MWVVIGESADLDSAKTKAKRKKIGAEGKIVQNMEELLKFDLEI